MFFMNNLSQEPVQSASSQTEAVPTEPESVQDPLCRLRL